MKNDMKAFNLARKKRETDSCDIIKESVGVCTNFKIGKTGQKLEDRFKEYKNEYDDIIEVYSSSEKAWVDNLEEMLITYFQKEKNYSSKCDNKQGGGGNDMGISGKYYIYIVRKTTSGNSK